MVTPRSTRRCADLKMAPLNRAFAAYDKSVHSIFITNGLGICSARRLADLWQEGLLHFITTRKSRHIPRDRERETAFLTPRAIPACTGAGRNKARVTERRSHLILRPGRFHSCVFDIRFFFLPRCSLFIRWLPAPRFGNYFFFHLVSSLWLTSSDCILAFDCYAASPKRQLGFWRLSKEQWRVYVHRFVTYSALAVVFLDLQR